MFTIILWTRIHDGRLVIRNAEEGFAVVFVTYDANDKKKKPYALHNMVIYYRSYVTQNHNLYCGRYCTRSSEPRV